MNLQTIAQYLHVACQQDAPITGITIDSRQVKPGSLFVALKGTQADGHDFAQDAANRGAAAVLCEHAIENITIPQLVVNDVAKALAFIAKRYRDEFAIPIIAITGSNGKTSVKEMIYACFPKPAFATPGNFNNQLGVPLSLLQLNSEHRYAVFELGANHVGEIAYTAKLINPDIALVNNIAPAHVGEFGSIEAIAQTKGEIYTHLAPHGTAIINEDDAYAHFWDTQLQTHPVLRFSRKKKTGVDIFADQIQINPQGYAAFTLHTPNWNAALILKAPGLHQVSNALAAASCCYAAGIDKNFIVKGLSEFESVSGRLTILKGCSETTVIDDTYNANLVSVLAAIDVLAHYPGKRILVFGDMGELGEHTDEHHKTVGETARQKKIDMLLTYGKHSKLATQAFGDGAHHFETREDLITFIKPKLEPHTTLLVKGSRSAGMEHIVSALTSSS